MARKYGSSPPSGPSFYVTMEEEDPTHRDPRSIQRLYKDPSSAVTAFSGPVVPQEHLILPECHNRQNQKQLEIFPHQKTYCSHYQKEEES